MSIDYKALANELTDDPLTRGYSGMDDKAAADDLNTVYQKVPVETVDGGAILNATDEDEYEALPAVDRTEWLALCAVLGIDIAAGVAKGIEARLFGGGTQTRADLGALKTQDVSRAVELGFGVVTFNDVAEARGSDAK